jgi:hypothetical protein
MSNHLAIATVTAALKAVIKAAIDEVADSAPGGPALEVSTVRPSDSDSLTKRGVNVFLHRVSVNPHWRNADLPTRRSSGTACTRPTAAVDLHYVLSFYGDEKRWEPQRFYGATLQVLHARPTLSRELVQRVVSSISGTTAFGFFADSDLADALELVRITPESLSLDDLSKLWSSFYQTEYALSVAYTASPVLIEADEPSHQALPVQAPTVRALPAAVPRIDSVRPVGDHITAGSDIALRGRYLRADDTRLSFDGMEGELPIDATQSHIIATLPVDLRAGVHAVQVVHRVLLGSPPTPHRGIESNVATFMLHPVISAVSVIDRSVRTDGTDTLVSGKLRLTITPEVGLSQAVVAWLNDASGSERGYSMVLPARTDTVPPSTTPSVDVPFSDALAGSYMVRVQIGGVGSVPASGTSYPVEVIA